MYFAVDRDTGTNMIRSLSQMQQDVDAMVVRLDRVDREVCLGELEEARAVSAINRMVASGGENSARAVLTQFRESLNAAIVAVQQGMANYQEVEAATEQQQQQLGERVPGPVRPTPRGGQIMS
jgi:hypothetical protein